MTDIKQEDLVEAPVVPTSETEEEKQARLESEAKQDPLKIELDKVKNSGRTEIEKAEFSLKKNAERVVELGGDPNAILGVPKPVSTEDDDQPITRGEAKKILSANATKTALQLADEIADPTEKELVKFYLENRIAPSGNPQDDLRDARRIVNSVKNEQIVEELSRKTDPKTHSNSSGGPTKKIEVEPTLTPQELLFTRPPFNMSVENVIKTRQG